MNKFHTWTPGTTMYLPIIICIIGFNTNIMNINNTSLDEII